MQCERDKIVQLNNICEHEEDVYHAQTCPAMCSVDYPQEFLRNTFCNLNKYILDFAMCSVDFPQDFLTNTFCNLNKYILNFAMCSVDYTQDFLTTHPLAECTVTTSQTSTLAFVTIL